MYGLGSLDCIRLNGTLFLLRSFEGSGNLGRWRYCTMSCKLLFFICLGVDSNLVGLGFPRTGAAGKAVFPAASDTVVFYLVFRGSCFDLMTEKASSCAISSEL
jgi:hypothetical protein